MKAPATTRLARDIYARVGQLQPVARRLLAEGIDDRRAEFSELVPCAEPSGLTEQQVTELIAWTEAVYAIGIALGLLLRPEAFEKGGAR